MSAEESFNLIDEAWIPVLSRDGRRVEVSILALFDRAAEFTAISGEVPTQDFAITRLLLAFLHRAVDGPASKRDWEQLWECAVLPMDRIRDYARLVHSRFDLFGASAPFFQVAGLHTATDTVSGLERMVADVPNGEPLFTTRSARNLERISAAEAARWLVHAHAFDPSGIKSGAVGDPTVKNGKGFPIGPGWSGQIGGVLLQGNDIRETLLLNLVGRDAASYVTIGGPLDIPAWERDPDGPGWQERTPRGAIELYTWQTRRVRLVGDRQGVTAVVLSNGDKLAPQNLNGLEPHSAWQLSEAQTKKHKHTVYMPRKQSAERSVWRGIAALLPCTSSRHGGGHNGQRFLAPGVLQWIGDLVAQGCLSDEYAPGVRVCGVLYGSQQATFAEIVDDTIPLPVRLLREDQPAAGIAAAEAVADAEAVAFEVWKLAENIAQAAGAEPKTGFGDAAREDFYALLDTPYRAWVSDLADEADLVSARLNWRQTLRRSAREVADGLVAGASPAAWIGREINDRIVNVALAEARFNAGLSRHAGSTTVESMEVAPA